MATVASERGVHPVAAWGYQRSVGNYQRGRPSYPAETVDWVAARIDPVGPLLDVGAGTGAMSSLLVERGFRLLAVEPVEAMAAALPPQLWRLRGAAADLPVRAGAVTAVIAATAFHWFARRQVLEEFARVLVRHGVVCLVWNVRDNNVPWVRAYTEIVEPYASGVPRYASMKWRDAVDESSDLFGWESQHQASNPSSMDREGLVRRILSTSFIAALDDPERAAVELQARQLADSLPQTFEYPYLTRTLLLRRR